MLQTISHHLIPFFVVSSAVLFCQILHLTIGSSGSAHGFSSDNGLRIGLFQMWRRRRAAVVSYLFCLTGTLCGGTALLNVKHPGLIRSDALVNLQLGCTAIVFACVVYLAWIASVQVHQFNTRAHP